MTRSWAVAVAAAQASQTVMSSRMSSPSLKTKKT
jgi:hypothetical protein